MLCAYQAEIKAILHALLFCKQFSLKEVIIECDAMLAMGWVNNKQNRPISLFSELNLIDFIMVEIMCIGVFHIFREANEEADKLAKEGVNRSEALWMFTP